MRIEDSAYEHFKAFLSLCPSIEIADEYSGQEIRKDFDVCMVEALYELGKNNVLHKPSDYTYIMQVINDRLVKDAPYFTTPSKFIGYLRELGIKDIPGRSTIYDAMKLIKGEYPNWTFNDPQIDDTETLRRKNVAQQFLSAFFRAQRRLSDGISDKA